MSISAEEDADLRDLVALALENNGTLSKIKAELRANVFMVLDAHEKNDSNQLPCINEKLKNFINTKEGRLITGLVREFLEFFSLDYTLAVFDPESNCGNCYQGREGLAEELKVKDVINESKPIISWLLENNTVSGKQKFDLSSVDEEAMKKSRLSNPDVSPRSVSSSSRNNSPQMSRIPQRVKDKKKVAEITDIKSPKDLIEKSLSNNGNRTGNSDLSLSLNDDDIIAELTKPSVTKTMKDSHFNERKTGFFIEEDINHPSFDESWLHNTTSSLPALKHQSLTSVPKDLRGITSSSTDLKELEDIDRRITELGFGFPAEDKLSSQKDDYNDSYADDFHPSTHSNEDNSSIPEEIDGEIVSLESFRSDRSKKDDDVITSDRTTSPVHDDVITSDRTISPVHDDFKDFDYGEDIDF